MNNLGEDQIRSAVRNLGMGPAGGVTPDLAQVKTIAHQRWRNAAAAVVACVVVATVGVAAAARTERASNTRVAEAPAPVGSPYCGDDFILELATAQQVNEGAKSLTVCSWSNAASGDAARDARSTLEAEQRLSETESTVLLDALRAAEPTEPTCYLIDSPPPLTYEILIPTTDGVRSVSVADMECLGFSLIGSSPLSSSRVLKAIRALKDLETQELTAVVLPVVSVDQFTDQALGTAQWNAAAQTLTYKDRYPKNTCNSNGEASLSGGSVNLVLTLGMADGICAENVTTMGVTITGLTEAPAELTVTEDGETKTLVVAVDK